MEITIPGKIILILRRRTGTEHVKPETNGGMIFNELQRIYKYGRVGIADSAILHMNVSYASYPFFKRLKCDTTSCKIFTTLTPNGAENRIFRAN